MFQMSQHTESMSVSDTTSPNNNDMALEINSYVLCQSWGGLIHIMHIILVNIILYYTVLYPNFWHLQHAYQIVPYRGLIQYKSTIEEMDDACKTTITTSGFTHIATVHWTDWAEQTSPLNPLFRYTLLSKLQWKCHWIHTSFPIWLHSLPPRMIHTPLKTPTTFTQHVIPSITPCNNSFSAQICSFNWQTETDTWGTLFRKPACSRHNVVHHSTGRANLLSFAYNLSHATFSITNSSHIWTAISHSFSNESPRNFVHSL